MQEMYKFLKRILDIIFSVLVILIILIPSLFLLLTIYLDTNLMPFYKQKRIGFHDKDFDIYKFRTMKKTKNCKDIHYEITEFGMILRKSSIDELPQVFNILIGKMSFIGPRPLLEKDVAIIYNEFNYSNMYIVKPGITGLAQVNGRKNISYEDRIKYNECYANNFSLKLDIEIVYKTIILIFSDFKHLINVKKYIRKENIDGKIL